MKFLRRSSYRLMPWKNGGGVTEEIDRVPDKDDYAWRFSRAHVQSAGPFSTFPGCDRYLTVLSGGGLLLNKTERLLPFDVHHFSGEAAVHCELLGESVWDLGLIFNRQKVAAEMKMVIAPQPASLDGDVHYLFAVDDLVELDGHRLPALDTIKKEGDALFRLNKGRLCVITIRFLQPASGED